MRGEVIALGIKDPEIERLVNEAAKIVGKSKTEAVRNALKERRERLALQVLPKDRWTEVIYYFELKVWPKTPSELLGVAPPVRSRGRS